MTAWATVHDRLLELAPAFTSLAVTDVYDGPTTARKYPANYTVIGSDGTDGQGNAGNYTQDFSDVGAMTEEQGTVNCLLVARSGSSDALATLRGVVDGWVGALRALISTDKRLGVLTQGSYVNVGSVDIRQKQSKDGAVVALVVHVTYFARF